MSVDSFWSFRYPPHPVWRFLPEEVLRPVSDDYYSSPIMTHHWCPSCQPDKDPLTELLEVQYCSNHRPSDRGEVELEFKEWDEKPEFDNNGACDLIHRGRLPGDTKTP